MATPEKPTPRILAIDALRGFDLVWIAGADSLSHALAAFRGGRPSRFLALQLQHVRWAGLHFNDFIFPLFVFLLGAVIPFSLGPLAETGQRRAALRRIGRRTLVLYLLGLFYYGGMAGGFEHVRLLGVLQRLALCYGASALLFLRLPPRHLLIVCLGLLIGYWALLEFVPVPGLGAGNLAEGENLANWIDRQFLPGWKWDGDHDPEGLLSTLPAIASCLLGVLAGALVRDPAANSRSKVGWLTGAGVLMLVAGHLWGIEFPIIKKIWTSSYVLVTAGWSAILLAVFFQVIEVWGVRRWAAPFVWLGANAITIYVLSNIIDFDRLSRRLDGGQIARWLDGLRGGLGGLVNALIGIVLCFFVARFLYRRKIFVRI